MNDALAVIATAACIIAMGVMLIAGAVMARGWHG